MFIIPFTSAGVKSLGHQQPPSRRHCRPSEPSASLSPLPAPLPLPLVVVTEQQTMSCHLVMNPEGASL